MMHEMMQKGVASPNALSKVKPDLRLTCDSRAVNCGLTKCPAAATTYYDAYLSAVLAPVLEPT
ncbi:MAG: hypothetical protein ABI206_11205, partial [Antricoccus sp.]